MIKYGPTEGAYVAWLKTLGPLKDDYQKSKAQQIILMARVLDAPSGSHKTLVERRAKLLRNIRWASKDLREAMANAKVAAVAEGK